MPSLPPVYPQNPDFVSYTEHKLGSASSQIEHGTVEWRASKLACDLFRCWCNSVLIWEFELVHGQRIPPISREAKREIRLGIDAGRGASPNRDRAGNPPEDGYDPEAYPVTPDSGTIKNFQRGWRSRYLIDADSV